MLAGNQALICDWIKSSTGEGPVVNEELELEHLTFGYQSSSIAFKWLNRCQLWASSCNRSPKSVQPPERICRRSQILWYGTYMKKASRTSMKGTLDAKLESHSVKGARYNEPKACPMQEMLLFQKIMNVTKEILQLSCRPFRNIVLHWYLSIKAFCNHNDVKGLRSRDALHHKWRCRLMRNGV